MYDFENMDQRLIAYVNIFVCANRLQAIMDSGLEDITAKQWLAITMIDAFPEPPTLKQMAEMSGVTHQSMRQIVDRLIDKGFLEVVPDKKDKRAIRLVKTEAANNIRTKKADQNISFVYRLFDCLSNEETTAYCSALAKLCDRLNELKEENDS
ncbi:MAG: MarR family transcriptional regulator [Ruminococcus sp.]|nr:MarR family transcriptional regulator [Ruminococcus sp.]